MVYCGCIRHPNKAATVRNSAMKRIDRKSNAEKNRDDVKYLAMGEKTIQNAVQQYKKIIRQLNVSYQDILCFAETGEVSLFDNINYKLSISIGLKPPRKLPTVCVFATGSGRILIKIAALNQSWLELNRKCDKSNVEWAFEIELEAPETATVQPTMVESRTRAMPGIANKVAVYVSFKSS